MRVWPIFLLLLGAMTGSAAQQPADALIGIYGALPRIRSVAISPNGAHVAFIQRVEGHDTFVVIDQRSGEVIGAANASEVKARSVYFATPNHVILIASRTLSHVRIRGDWEHHNAVVYDIRTGDLTRLPRKQMNLFVGQSGLGRLIGVDSENARVYLPAFFEAGREPSNHLMEIDLDDGDARIHEEGNAHTVDWFVGRGGRVLAREDFDNKKHLHIVYSYASGEPVELYRSETEIPDLRIEGVSDDESALVVVAKVGAADAVHRISLADGSWSEPAHVQSDGEIDSVVTFPPERFAHGIRVSGPLPSYLLFDEVDNRIMAGLQ